MHVPTYSLHADSNNAPNAMTMGVALPTLHSSTTSVTLHSPTNHDLACSAHGCHHPLPTTDSTKWPIDSCALYRSTSKVTTATHYIQTLNQTKITEKEFNALLLISTQGHLTTTTTTQHPSSNPHTPTNAQSPSVRPCHHCIVRVICNIHTTVKQFHPTSHSTMTPTTHSMPTIVPKMGHGSNTPSHHPQHIIRV